MALAFPPQWHGGPGLRSEVHPRQPQPCPCIRRRLLSTEQCKLFEGLGSRGWVFLQTLGLLCKTGFDSQAWRPQVPVGRQAGAGGFVWQEEGPWRLRNKAWDRAGLGCGWAWAVWSRLGCQWGQRSLCWASPFSPGFSWPHPSAQLSHIYGWCCWTSRLHGGPLGPQVPIWE